MPVVHTVQEVSDFIHVDFKVGDLQQNETKKKSPQKAETER